MSGGYASACCAFHRLGSSLFGRSCSSAAPPRWCFRGVPMSHPVAVYPKASRLVALGLAALARSCGRTRPGEQQYTLVHASVIVGHPMGFHIRRRWREAKFHEAWRDSWIFPCATRISSAGVCSIASAMRGVAYHVLRDRRVFLVPSRHALRRGHCAYAACHARTWSECSQQRGVEQSSDQCVSGRVQEELQLSRPCGEEDHHLDVVSRDVCAHT